MIAKSNMSPLTKWMQDSILDRLHQAERLVRQDLRGNLDQVRGLLGELEDRLAAADVVQFAADGFRTRRAS